jgi:transposase
VPPRPIFEAILWILRTGAPWHDLPDRYPPYQTCHRRFQTWVRAGVPKKLLRTLYEDLRSRGQVDDTEAFIDGTYAPAKKGGLKVGRCRAGNATKIMALADGAGLPTSIGIADGSRHDVTLVDDTLDAAWTDDLAPVLVADKVFDSGKLADSLRAERDIELVAPKRSGPNQSRRKQDGRRLRRYRRRWKVERLFAWLKQFRRVVVRWERKASNYLGILQLGCAVILLRHF